MIMNKKSGLNWTYAKVSSCDTSWGRRYTWCAWGQYESSHSPPRRRGSSPWRPAPLGTGQDGSASGTLYLEATSLLGGRSSCCWSVCQCGGPVCVWSHHVGGLVSSLRPLLVWRRLKSTQQWTEQWTNINTITPHHGATWLDTPLRQATAQNETGELPKIFIYMYVLYVYIFIYSLEICRRLFLNRNLQRFLQQSLQCPAGQTTPGCKWGPQYPLGRPSSPWDAM